MRYTIAMLVCLMIATGPVHGQEVAGGDPLAQSLLKDPVARDAAIKGLSLFEDSKTAAAILGNYGAFDATSRLAAVNALSYRTSNAMALMAAVKEQKVPRGDLTAETLGQLRALGDPQIEAWLDQTWAVVRATPAAKLKEIKKYKTMLGAQGAKADPGRGRALFVNTCQQCHVLHGVGGKVGPDITGASRADLNYLLVNIIDPSSVIARDYQVTNVWTKDDQILSGIASKEDDNTLTIVTDTTSTTIQKGEIETTKKSAMSMMPEGQLLSLAPQDLINLMSYLRTSAQVPLPPGAASQPTVQKIAAIQPAAQKGTANAGSPQPTDADQMIEPQAPI